MIQIIFIKDFATKVKGDIWECDGMSASQLIGGDKVAKLYVEPKKAPLKAK